jgi:NADH dehydrogenase
METRKCAMKSPLKIVILGGGFGGLETAKHLRRLARSGRAQVRLISDSEAFVFTPFLCEVAGGSIELRHVVQSIREMVVPWGVGFTQARVEGLDPEARLVLTSRGPVAYDYLVVGLGSTVNFYGVEGAQERCLRLHQLADAQRLRTRLGAALEEAAASKDAREERPIRCIVIGAGPTGVELVCELADMLNEVLSRCYPELPAQAVEMTLLEAGENILGIYPPKLQAYAEDRIHAKGIRVRKSAPVVYVEEQSIHLANGEAVPCDIAIWTAGIKPNPVLSNMHLPLTEQGFLRVDSTLQVPGHQTIYGLGDCTSCISDFDGKPLPAEAQVAVQQAQCIARNLAAQLEGRPLEMFRYHHYGRLISLGTRYAITDFMRVRFSGFIGWWIWRTIYLIKLRRLKNILRVMLDWTIDFFFGRELYRLPGIEADSRRVEDEESYEVTSKL